MQKLRSYDVAEVRAAPATYVANQGAYRVEDVRDGYPDPTAFDEDRRAETLEAYRQLKAKQLRDGTVRSASAYVSAKLALLGAGTHSAAAPYRIHYS